MASPCITSGSTLQKLILVPLLSQETAVRHNDVTSFAEPRSRCLFIYFHKALHFPVLTRNFVFRVGAVSESEYLMHFLP